MTQDYLNRNWKSTDKIQHSFLIFKKKKNLSKLDIEKNFFNLTEKPLVAYITYLIKYWVVHPYHELNWTMKNEAKTNAFNVSILHSTGGQQGKTNEIRRQVRTIRLWLLTFLS